MTCAGSVGKNLNGLVQSHLGALSLREETAIALSPFFIALTLVFHLLGLAVLFRLWHQPVWLALPVLVLLLAIPFWIYRSRGAAAVETLAPLYFLYAILAARFVFVRGFAGTVPGYFDYNLPDLQSTLFRIEPWVACAFIYTLTIQIRFLATRVWPRVLIGTAMVVAFATFAWAGELYIGHRTSGVTGSDPYAYTQMAVDLATRGTPLHEFTLFPSIAALGIPWSPIVHTGYHVPIDARGDAPTVWPFGGSLAMAIAYRIFGEGGLYLVNPLMSLLALAAMGWLAWELFAEHALETRVWIVALGAVILATSHTLFDWATVPMVDAQAALFSIVAVGCALRYVRRPTLIWAILCGVTLGMAYFIRHTQVLIAPAILVLLWSSRARGRAILAGGASAALVALPDLWYHQVVFGGWLNVESTELGLFSLASVGSTCASLAAGLLAAREFGWLVPFFLFGVYRLARENHRAFLALSLWVVVLVAFHLPYPALRLRDLLPEFVPLVVVTAYGVVEFAALMWTVQQPWQRFAAAGGLMVTLFLLLIRVWNIVPLLWNAPQPAFGYVTAAQRASFAQIAALTPPRAVIGSSLNTGAIDLYAGREAFHPEMWSEQERDVFLAAMFHEGRAVYLLDDSDVTSVARRELVKEYALRQVTVLDVPLFGTVDGTPGALWEIRP